MIVIYSQYIFVSFFISFAKLCVCENEEYNFLFVILFRRFSLIACFENCLQGWDGWMSQIIHWSLSNASGTEVKIDKYLIENEIKFFYRWRKITQHNFILFDQKWITMKNLHLSYFYWQTLAHFKSLKHYIVIFVVRNFSSLGTWYRWTIMNFNIN